MKKIYSHSWFTLVEVLVAMTIFSMTMVSVLVIYATASEIAIKTDINREMQQNIKSVVEAIAEDVRKNANKNETPILVHSNISPYVPVADWITENTHAIQIGNNKYYLVELDQIRANWSNGITNTDCNDIENVCVLAKVDSSGDLIWPLSNSKISFTHLNFYVTNGDIPKITINFTARAAINNWLRNDLIENSTLHFQTTISERHLQVK